MPYWRAYYLIWVSLGVMPVYYCTICSIHVYLYVDYWLVRQHLPALDGSNTHTHTHQALDAEIKNAALSIVLQAENCIAFESILLLDYVSGKWRREGAHTEKKIAEN